MVGNMDTPKKPFLIERIIEASARNPFLVILFTLFGIGGGLWALTRTPLDARARGGAPAFRWPA